MINEFLLQSVGGIIRVFPAWPADKDASFSKLRAQGGFLVTAEHRHGKPRRIEVMSTVGGKLRLLSPWSVLHKHSDSGRTAVKVDGRGVFEMDTKAGEKYVFTGE